MKKRDMFSHRNSYEVVKAIQKDRLDKATRNRIWNVVDYYLNLFIHRHEPGFFQNFQDVVFSEKSSVDLNEYRLVSSLRDGFDNYAWYLVYNIIEFIYNEYPVNLLNISPLLENSRESFAKKINKVFEEENVAYRFINGRISPITSIEEIKEIEAAIDPSGVKPGIPEHLKKALELLSDRKAPDYPNSIKESISAVEAMCRAITGSEATLGDALKAIQKSGQFELHPTLSQAFSKLYGYTCDADGIRHGTIDISKTSSEDARFFLVTCSAFVNYLKIKADKARLKLD